MKLSVIIPMLNEERAILATVDAVQRGAPQAELIIVDGGSTDRSVERARARGPCLIEAARGRARQMNAGASVASGDALVFVHADSLMPPGFAAEIAAALADPAVVGGRFDIELDPPSWSAHVLARLINLRSRLMHSATGDQAIFVRREIFTRLGGFANLELCEDVEFIRRLKRSGRLACLRSLVITSARRWQQGGVLRTVLRMWVIKLLFFAGVSPARLRRHYADTR